jgi:thiosulfate reductase cytochrome b subunit
MADAAWAASASAVHESETAPRHSAVVRVTHWITTVCFLALLVTGMEIVVSHPRFYWGETGNVTTSPLFKIPIPASRGTVPTGYSYTLPDQNGWSRYLHFEAAWGLVLTGLAYVAAGLVTRHFRTDLVDGRIYNPIQRLTYLIVIFMLFPLVVWTGLAMSPAVVSAVPGIVTVLGGQQSARTIHFFVSLALLLFLFVHVVMVWRAGFWELVRAMITGGAR